MPDNQNTCHFHDDCQRKIDATAILAARLATEVGVNGGPSKLAEIFDRLRAIETKLAVETAKRAGFTAIGGLVGSIIGAIIVKYLSR